MRDFVHLHVHSIGSVMDGLNKIEDIVDKAKTNGQKAIALTDHGNINQIINFYYYAKESGIKPLIGMEAYFVDDMNIKDKTNKHIVLIAKNNQGLSNLYKIVSEANRNGFYYKPRLDWNILEKYHEGLIITTGCQNGILSNYILKDNDIDTAMKVLNKLYNIFKDDLYIELQYHNIKLETDNKDIKTDGDYFNILKNIAIKMNIPFIITNDSHYTNDEDYIAHNIIVASAWGKQIKNPNDIRFTIKDESIKDGDSLFEIMAPVFGAKETEYAFQNTVKIADKCNVEIESSLMHLPELQKGLDAERYLTDLTYKMAYKKYGNPLPKHIQKRIETELDLINGTGFANYFLILRDIIENSGVNFGNARGSAAGSLVSYLIGITKVDPLKYGLLFERFLNIGRTSLVEEQFEGLMTENNTNNTIKDHLQMIELLKHKYKIDIYNERINKELDYFIETKNGIQILEKILNSNKKTKDNKLNLYLLELLGKCGKANLNEAPKVKLNTTSPPDIDVDVSYLNRQKAIDYIKNKYGDNNVNHISTYVYIKIKMAIQEVGRVLGIPYGIVLQASKTIPNLYKGTIYDAIEEFPKLKKMYNDVFINNFGEKITGKDWFDLSQKIIGTIKAQSIHAAGIIITPEDTANYAPIVKTNGVLAVGFDGPTAEHMGLLKLDLLGLKTVDVIYETIKLIEEKHGIKIDPYKDMDLDDVNVYKNIYHTGMTDFCFQFSSDGMKNLLQQAKPDNLAELAIMNALYRPGAMRFIDDYIAIKNGDKPKDYIFEELKPILEETKSVFVYQEQLMSAAQILSSFSKAEADALRRGIAKKKPEVLVDLKEKFISRAVKNGYNKDKIEDIWKRRIVPAGEYSFNKSHAVSYAMLSFFTAWLMNYYPTETITTYLNIYSSNREKLMDYINLSQKYGIKILPPDINTSNIGFTAVKESIIRVGLSSIKGIGEKAAEEIINNRPYKNILDFLRKNTTNKKVLESLILSGAFDEYYPNRQDLYNNIDQMINLKNAPKTTLFGDPEEILIPNKKLTVHNTIFLAKKEIEVLGLFITYSLDDILGKVLHKLNGIPLADLVKYADINSTYKTYGIIKEVKLTKTKRKKQAMAFITITDGQGNEMRCVLFPETYEQYHEYVNEDNIVFIQGQYQEDGNMVITDVKLVKEA